MRWPVHITEKRQWITPTPLKCGSKGLIEIIEDIENQWGTCVGYLSGRDPMSCSWKGDNIKVRV
jgi:hypothetical protein